MIDDYLKLRKKLENKCIEIQEIEADYLNLKKNFDSYEMWFLLSRIVISSLFSVLVSYYFIKPELMSYLVSEGYGYPKDGFYILTNSFLTYLYEGIENPDFTILNILFMSYIVPFIISLYLTIKRFLIPFTLLLIFFITLCFFGYPPSKFIMIGLEATMTTSVILSVPLIFALVMWKFKKLPSKKNKSVYVDDFFKKGYSIKEVLNKKKYILEEKINEIQVIQDEMGSLENKILDNRDAMKEVLEIREEKFEELKPIFDKFEKSTRKDDQSYYLMLFNEKFQSIEINNE